MRAIKYSVFICCLYVLFNTALADAADIVTGHIRVEITKITYNGNDNYEIEISLKNNSDTNTVIKKVRKQFNVQSEVLGQWIELGIERDTELSGNISIEAYKERSLISVVNIPLSIPKMYLNGFGDLNLKLVSELTLKVSDRPTDFIQADESSYWITPGTDKWILREGM
jgi:hypothetical protein